MNVVYFILSIAAIALAVWFFVRRRYRKSAPVDPEKHKKRVGDLHEKVKEEQKEAKDKPADVLEYEVNKSMKNIKRLMDGRE